MGIFNQHSNNQPHQSFLRGLRGSPGVGFSLTRDGNYDMTHKKLKNVGEGVESSDAVTKHQLEVSLNTKLDKASLNNYVKKNSPEVGGDLDMKGFSIKNLKVNRGGDGSATSRKYVDRKLGTKANRNDLNNYLKLDGTSQMQGNLVMNDKRITRLPEPQLADEPATKNYVLITMNHLPSLLLDRQGKSKMLGELQMNDHRITGLTNLPNADDEATNKKYVDDNISKANIKPSHSPKNVFQYLMDDVNEWSSEYNVKVGSFSDLPESPHPWDKKVLNLSPLKKDGNYRFRVGLQMFRMTTNKEYLLVVELYNRDYKTWQRQQTFVEGMGMWVINHNTTKYQYTYGSSGDLYYSKTFIKFKKTSFSLPIFVYYTVHFDDDGGHMNTYPKEFKNQVYLVAYGIEGLSDHVNPEVYDANEAFEIDKTKMEMLVPLDMNGKKLMNTNFDLKFGDIFKIIKCYVSLANRYRFFKKSDNQILTLHFPVVLHGFTFYNTKKLDNNTKIYVHSRGGLLNDRTVTISSHQSTGRFHNYNAGTNNDNTCTDLSLICIFNSGIDYFKLTDAVPAEIQFDIDVIITHM